MTEPSKAAVKKANALVRAATPPNVLSSAKIDPSARYIDDAFVRFIDHVSEVAKDTLKDMGGCGEERWHELRCKLTDLTLPDPEPDVLYDALFAVVEMGRYDTREQTQLLHSELKSRGYEIRKVKP